MSRQIEKRQGGGWRLKVGGRGTGLFVCRLSFRVQVHVGGGRDSGKWLGNAGEFGGVWERQVRAPRLRKRGMRTNMEGKKENNCRKMADPKIQGVHEGGGTGIGTGNPVDFLAWGGGRSEGWRRWGGGG